MITFELENLIKTILFEQPHLLRSKEALYKLLTKDHGIDDDEESQKDVYQVYDEVIKNTNKNNNYNMIVDTRI